MENPFADLENSLFVKINMGQSIHIAENNEFSAVSCRFGHIYWRNP